ncbi:hypothetical protein M6B38_401200 [Iris pallida]|uniref:Uncharacterized protein n=1 Tax=Iris pallida TaxID=29817 RepID=A0AAX6FUA1_IRIPA|nr:hypothetical protein M6B38_401200 [Iris pallida]
MTEHRTTRRHTRQDTLPLLFKFPAQYHACFSCLFFKLYVNANYYIFGLELRDYRQFSVSH